PGSSTVALVPLPENAPSAVTIEVADDPEPFDNRLWLVRPPPRELPLHYLGADAANDSTQPRFYPERAIACSRVSTARFPTGPPPDDDRHSLTIIAEPLDATLTANLRAYLQSGGFALVLVHNDETLRTAAALAGESNWAPTPPANTDAMFGQLDFQHPLF